MFLFLVIKPVEEVAVCGDRNIPITSSEWPEGNDYNKTSTDGNGRVVAVREGFLLEKLTNEEVRKSG